MPFQEGKAGEKPHELSGISKTELSLLFALVGAALFMGIIVYFISVAEVEIAVAGTIDVNLFMVAFISIVLAVFSYLGIRKQVGTTAPAPLPPTEK